MVKHIKSSKKEQMHPDCECLDLLRVLSDKIRQEIIAVISSKGEINVNDIAEHFSLSRPTISHHLNLMKRNKLLNSRKAGKEIFYSFNKPHVIKILESLVNDLDKCC